MYLKNYDLILLSEGEKFLLHGGGWSLRNTVIVHLPNIKRISESMFLDSGTDTCLDTSDTLASEIDSLVSIYRMERLRTV